MKQRAKQLMALVMAWVMIVMMSPVAMAEAIPVGGMDPNVTITEDSFNDYDVKGSGNLTIKSPASLSGTVKFSGSGIMQVESGASMIGTITIADGNVIIGNAGKIAQPVDFRGTQNNSFTANSGSETAELLLGKNTLQCDSGAKFGTLDLSDTENKLICSGTMEAGTLRYNVANSIAEGVQVRITKALQLQGTERKDIQPVFQLADADVKVRKPSAADPVEVQYEDHKYTLPAGELTGKSLNDLYAYTVSEAGDWSLPNMQYAGTPATLTVTLRNTGSEAITLNPVIDAGSAQFFAYACYNADGSIVSTDGIHLDAGASATVKLTSRADLEVGTYTGSFSITAGVGDTPYWKTKQGNIKLVVEKAEGTGSLQIADRYYGTDYSVQLQSATHDTKTAQMMYRKQGTDTWTADRPVKPGIYEAKAVLPENAHYRELTLTDSFKIMYYPTPKTAYTMTGTTGKNGYYTSDVVYRAVDGFLMSETPDGKYTKTLRYQKSQAAHQLYLKKEKTGEITEPITVPAVKIDKTKPEYSCEQKLLNGDIYYGESCVFTFQDQNLASVTVNGKVHTPKSGKHSISVVLKAGDDIKTYKLQAKDAAGNTVTLQIRVAEEWRKTGKIMKGKAVRLYKDQAYHLDQGIWKVAGDETSYQGGQSFYVDSEGEYTFSQSE